MRLKAQILAMRFALARLLASICYFRQVIFLYVLSSLHAKRKRLIIVALALESNVDSSAGKIETLGSIFSHETEGLLAPSATILISLFRPHIRLTNPSGPMVLIRLVQNQMLLTAQLLRTPYEPRFDT